jgi:dolichol-phosphate mannosyltransferase
MSKISIIVPVYFNEMNLHGLFGRLYPACSDPEHEYEFVFVDDGSEDGSYSILKTYAEKDARVKIIKLSRNFGSFVASLAGIRNSTGDCVVVISADLQDPPEKIPEMVREWRNGYRVVLAVREAREDAFWIRQASALFYRLLRKFALKDMPPGGFDFFLVDRRVADILSSMEEKNTSLIGLVLWTGFNRKLLYYTRLEREHGRSMWTLTKKVKYFIDSFTAFSYSPIRLVSILGCLISFLAFLYITLIFLMYFMGISTPTGWSATMVVILMTSGIQLILLGVIGEYLWRNFDETRKRPVYIIDHTVGIEKPK